MQDERPPPLHIHGLSEQTQAHSLQEKGKSESRNLTTIVNNFLVQKDNDNWLFQVICCLS